MEQVMGLKGLGKLWDVPGIIKTARCFRWRAVSSVCWLKDDVQRGKEGTGKSAVLNGVVPETRLEKARPCKANVGMEDEDAEEAAKGMPLGQKRRARRPCKR
jgi:hypothetical protein